jgi:hypothetical protein
MFEKYNEWGAVDKANTLSEYLEDVLAVIQRMIVIIIIIELIHAAHPHFTVWRLCCHCCYTTDGIVTVTVTLTTTIFGISNYFNSVPTMSTIAIV